MEYFGYQLEKYDSLLSMAHLQFISFECRSNAEGQNFPTYKFDRKKSIPRRSSRFRKPNFGTHKIEVSLRDNTFKIYFQ